MSTLIERAPVTVAELVAAVRDRQIAPAKVAVQPEPSSTPTSTVLVVGAHGGAGATVVAVALADALSQTAVAAERVHLIDLAPSDTSGMASAGECEVGSPYPGWRASRRGAVSVLRPAAPTGSFTAFPRLPDPAHGLLVIDAGCTPLPGPIRGLAQDQRTVVVCRATAPGVRRAEVALTALDSAPLLVAVGARRWPREVQASFGPHVGGVVDGGRAVLFPADRTVEVNGIGPGPFPRPIAAAAMSLAGLVRSATPAGDRQSVRGLR